MSLAKGVAESLKSPIARGVLEYCSESIWQVGFAKSLSLPDAAEVTSVSPRGTEMVYRVPANVCITGGTVSEAGTCGEGQPFLPCGVTIALFDEVSTMAMVVADKTHRPGVSICLSCQTFHPVGPGELVTFKSRGLKMGARLGFGEASMYREDGKLAARGRHVKYLPMGRMWDLAMTPLAFPLTRITSNRLRDRVLADPERTKGIPPGDHLMDMFLLEDFARVESPDEEQLGGLPPFASNSSGGSGNHRTHERNDTSRIGDNSGNNGGGAAGAGVSGGSCGSGGRGFAGGIRSAEAEVLVTRRQCNFIPGSFHGGAIAVAAEEIGRRCPPPSLISDFSAERSSNARVQYMEVHYMSAIKRRAGLAAVSTSAEETGTEVTRVGLSEAGGTQGGALSAEAVLLWGEAAAAFSL